MESILDANHFHAIVINETYLLNEIMDDENSLAVFALTDHIAGERR